MTMLRICWTIDGITLLIALYFFVEGIAIKSPEYGFFVVWFALLGLLAAGLFGSYWLLNHDHPTWATPGLLYSLPCPPSLPL